MPLDVATWASLASLVVSVISLFPRNKLQRTQEQEAALLAVSEAYHETAGYLNYRASHERNQEREWSIAYKWDRAAKLLRRYGADLSHRLGVKSRFWREGGIWDAEAVQEGVDPNGTRNSATCSPCSHYAALVRIDSWALVRHGSVDQGTPKEPL